MTSGSRRSRTPLESDSDAEDAHPVDAVIQAAISRQLSPASDVNRKGRASKRKREAPPQPDMTSLHSSSDEDSRASKEPGAKQDQASPSKVIPAAGIAPIGVTVVEEGAQTRNAEVQRLLRGGRQVPHLEFAVIKPGKLTACCSPPNPRQIHRPTRMCTSFLASA